MRRTVLIAVTMTVALLLGMSTALAAAVSGTQGNDTLRGTRVADQIYGLNGNDTLYGFARNDHLYGGAGNDNLYGQGGIDEIYGGSGRDNLYGGPGRDYLNSADNGAIDIVDCGPGDGVVDRVVSDGDDVERNCVDGQDVVTRVAP